MRSILLRWKKSLVFPSHSVIWFNMIRRLTTALFLHFLCLITFLQKERIALLDFALELDVKFVKSAYDQEMGSFFQYYGYILPFS